TSVTTMRAAATPSFCGSTTRPRTVAPVPASCAEATFPHTATSTKAHRAARIQGFCLLIDSQEGGLVLSDLKVGPLRTVSDHRGPRLPSEGEPSRLRPRGLRRASSFATRPNCTKTRVTRQ